MAKRQKSSTSDKIVTVEQEKTALELAETFPTLPAFHQPHRMTRDRVVKVIDALRRGNYVTTASRLAGLDPETVSDWLRRAARPDEPEDSLYKRFQVAVEQAQAEWEAETVDRIYDAGSRDWKAHAALLGRRHRDRWSEQRNPDANQQPVTINIGFALPGLPGQSSQVLEAQVVSVPELPPASET